MQVKTDFTILDDGQTYSDEGPQCPYCGYQITADEGGYYNEDYDEEECGNCEKTFRVSVYHSTSWTCDRMDDE